LVTALKNDLRTPGVGGRKFFDLIAENSKNTSNEIYMLYIICVAI